MNRDDFGHRKRENRFSRPRRHDDEDMVQNGLSLTPSQMLEMAQKGVPVTPQNMLGSIVDEGMSRLDFEPPIEHQRGVDMGDLWERREEIRGKFRTLRDKGQFKQPDVKSEGAE